MSYRIIYSQKAEKQLKKLPRDITTNIIKALERIRVRPYNYVRKVVGTDTYRLKVGNYRIILDIIDYQLVILVISAGHRKNIYRNK